MLDNALLESFLAVVEEGSFTQAAERLGLTQSSVSQHIKRLETQVGRSLLHRSTHRVGLLPDGERLLVHARRILGAVMEAERAFGAPMVSGHVSVGVAEDFATSRLPDILRRFRRFYPHVILQIEIGLSANLIDKLHAGFFDVILAKTRTPSEGAEPLMTDQLMWVAAPDEPMLYAQRPLPLALHPEPSISRRMVIEALHAAAIPFQIAHTSLSITGLRAGIVAGLGISVFGRSFIPEGLLIIDEAEAGLPRLPSLPFVVELQKGAEGSPAVQALVQAIRENVAMLDRHFDP
ncbi:LysR family transcriptional regulator [Gluconacetobacter takamatsuzukensis]|uniref:LysR family transcriptional regulator n=1 Tax=Gluconacetobacter takamatsuzukensis TaxID=1286190 RepID=A0A7W4PQ26_9PROT|nr:LysR substrate-binding domain-containing protein [Gluconacetobacter takamatsuzukensis]MBB2205868.1 LysR family transcriptional regulator [Gluconacetobacter takamatsuzukensis]